MPLGQEERFFWRDETLNGTELLRATYFTHTFAPHTHEEYSISIVMAGAEQFRVGRNFFQAPTGALVLINPGEVHTGERAVPEGWQNRSFYPTVALMEQVQQELTGKTTTPFFSETVVSDPDTTNLLIQMHQVLETEPSPLARKSWFFWGFSQLIAQHGEHPVELPVPGEESLAVAKVRAYLEDNYATSITLEDLAAHVHFSPFHLLRVFKQATGLPPHAYLVGVRVRRAKEFLAVGMSPAEVAQCVGFADQSHLYRHFKRAWGITPGQYIA